MADLVLANLTIDSSGAVGGIAQFSKASRTGEIALKSFGEAGERSSGMLGGFVERLFSMEHAMSLVTRVLSVGHLAFLPVIFTVERAVEEVVKGTDAFKAIAQSFNDFVEDLKGGDDVISRVGRHLKDLGGEDPVTMLNKLKELVDQRKKILAELASIRPGPEVLPLVPASERMGWQTALPGAGKEFDAVVQALHGKLALLEQDVSKTIDGLTKSGVTAAAILEATGEKVGQVIPSLEEKIATATRVSVTGKDPVTEAKEFADATLKTADALGKEGAASALAAEKWRVYNVVHKDAIDEGQKAYDVILSQIKILREFDQATAKTADMTKLLNDVLETAAKDWAKSHAAFTDFAVGLKDKLNDVHLAKLALDGLGQAASVMGGLLANAFAGVKESVHQSVANLMLDLSRMAFAYSLFCLAAAAVSSTLAGAALMGGSPHQFLVAAALFAAVGAAAGLAARALGAGNASGAGASGSSGGRRNRDTTGTQAASIFSNPNRPTVTINVQGSMFGTDPNNLARDIAKLVTTAQMDGATI